MWPATLYDPKEAEAAAGQFLFSIQLLEVFQSPSLDLSSRCLNLEARIHCCQRGLLCRAVLHVVGLGSTHWVVRALEMACGMQCLFPHGLWC